MTVEGSTRKWSNWHATKREAFDHLLEKITGSKNTGRDCVVPALSQHSSDVSGVSIVHQIYGVFRDGKEMYDLFKLSSKAWQAYCRRNNIRYILWSADHLDCLILTYAPPFVVALYKKVRYVVQRVDIGRFFVLYVYGGLYADLDVLPNRESYPQVTLGLCKMASRARSRQREWEIEVVVASRGNPNLLELILHLELATQEKSSMKAYLGRPCRYIYNTTGPVSVAHFFNYSELGRKFRRNIVFLFDAQAYREPDQAGSA